MHVPRVMQATTMACKDSMTVLVWQCRDEGGESGGHLPLLCNVVQGKPASERYNSAA